MVARIGLWTVLGLLVASVATAQVGGQQAAPGYPAGQTQGPPQQNTPQQTGASPAVPPSAQPLPAPFVLAPNEQAQLNRVLKAWEQSSANVQTFECNFTRWQYNAFNKDPLIHRGIIKYAAPDKGLFRVDGDRPEQWICDGKSVFEFSYTTKELKEYKLPPELQGKSIVNGPLPFMFGAQAERLNQRYFLRLRPESTATQIILEAYPRFQQDAANFSKLEMILDIKSNSNLQPSAVQISEPGGQNRTVFAFENPLVNFKDPLSFLKGNPFQPRVPGMDWRRVLVEDQGVRQARRPD